MALPARARSATVGTSIFSMLTSVRSEARGTERKGEGHGDRSPGRLGEMQAADHTGHTARDLFALDARRAHTRRGDVAGGIDDPVDHQLAFQRPVLHQLALVAGVD